MHPAGRGEQRVGHVLRAELRERAERGQHRAVARAGEADAHARRLRAHADRADVDPVERLQHRAAERVVAHAPRHRHPQPEPRGARGHDRARAAEHQRRLVDELLALPEGRHEVAAAQHEVRVDVPDDEEVEPAHASRGSASPCASISSSQIVRIVSRSSEPEAFGSSIAAW